MEELFVPLRPLFADKLLKDDREPVASFSIVDGQYALFAPRLGFWVQLLEVVLVCTVIQCVVAVVLYFGIVKRRGTTASYFLGWGILIPLSLPFTFWIIDGLAISNKVLKLGAGNISMVTFFRSIEAMYGTSPPVTELSVTNYVAYYSTAAPYVWTEKGRKTPTGADLMAMTKRCLLHYVALAFVVSFMLHFDFRPFASNVVLNEFHINWDLLAPGHMANAYCQTVLTYLTLYNLFEINALGENLKGALTEKIFQEPLIASRTPTEFWTVRWNRMVHKLLKGGIFRPSKQFFGPRISILLTFLFSGLLHDYIWMCVFHHSDYLAEQEAEHSIRPFVPIFGKLTAFFMYTGVMMVLERPFCHLSIVRTYGKRVPTIVVATFLVILHLPFSHWYTGDWVEGGFFRDLSLGLFLVRKV